MCSRRAADLELELRARGVALHFDERRARLNGRLPCDRLLALLLGPNPFLTARLALQRPGPVRQAVRIYPSSAANSAVVRPLSRQRSTRFATPRATLVSASALVRPCTPTSDGRPCLVTTRLSERIRYVRVVVTFVEAQVLGASRAAGTGGSSLHFGAGLPKLPPTRHEVGIKEFSHARSSAKPICTRIQRKRHNDPSRPMLGRSKYEQLLVSQKLANNDVICFEFKWPGCALSSASRGTSGWIKEN